MEDTKEFKAGFVTIMGRPNVGKSTFINRIVKKNKAITMDTPGVTRDLAYFPTSWKNKDFVLIDSGGIILEDEKDFHLQKKGDGTTELVINEEDGNGKVIVNDVEEVGEIEEEAEEVVEEAVQEA